MLLLAILNSLESVHEVWTQLLLLIIQLSIKHGADVTKIKCSLGKAYFHFNVHHWLDVAHTTLTS